MPLPRTELPQHRRRPAAAQLGGPEGNERLTALVGATLLVLFAAEGVTLLRLGRLLYWHYFLGFLLVAPVCLKIASTVYRFTRYYTRHEPYLRKGPPHPLLRIVGPFIVLSTIVVIGTGVLLGLQKQPHVYLGFSLLLLHKLSFVGWAALMTVHVLAYLPRLPQLLTADLHTGRGGRSGGADRIAGAVSAVGGRSLRYSLLALALGAGLILAEWGAQLSSSWHR